MAVQRIRVKSDLGVYANKLIIFTQCKWIHFEQGEVIVDKSFICTEHQICETGNLTLSSQSKHGSSVTSLKSLHTNQGIDLDFCDFLWCRFGHFFNFYPALRGHHKHHTPAASIDHGT